MSWKGKAVSVLNNAIAPAGLFIDKISNDFDARLVSEKHLKRMHQAMADAFAGWLGSQHVILNPVPFDVLDHINRFYVEYLSAPYRGQHGGSRYNNTLWLSLIARTINPSIIVDSGTYTGASAWALSLGAPASPIFSFDINLSHLCARYKNCTYAERDWATQPWGNSDTSNGLCYFDDHVDQAKRLIEARDRGFRYAVFDDDFELGAFAPMAHGSHALPKIEFVLDPNLLDGEELSWIAGPSSFSWKVDRAYLDRAKSTIEDTERLPNTSLITGIHQTPYRVVRLKTH